MTTYTVGYFVGSLAKESINRKLAGALVRLAPKELQLTEIPFLHSSGACTRALRGASLHANDDQIKIDREEHDHTPEEEREIRDGALDDTIAATFPASDPLSSIPNPDVHHSERDDS